jgi:hypothetical protein
MFNDGPSYTLRHIRGLDSNSLLRLYDQANLIVDKSLSQLERIAADKAIRRIVKELEKRNVSFRTIQTA